jgi:hypothetical protein
VARSFLAARKSRSDPYFKVIRKTWYGTELGGLIAVKGLAMVREWALPATDKTGRANERRTAGHYKVSRVSS